MKFSLLTELVKSHAKKLANIDGLSGGRGDGGSYKLLQELELVKQELIITNDLRPSEVESKVPEIDIGNGAGFKTVIDAAKLELVEDMTYEELAKWIKVL